MTIVTTNITKLFIASLFAMSLTNATVMPTATNTTNVMAVVHELEGNGEEKYNDLVENKIKELGFSLTDPHKRVNDGYKKKYGKTNLDYLSFMSIVQDTKMRKLLEKDPRLAGFSPFNMLGYKKLSENKSYLMHLNPDLMLDIMGISDKSIRNEYKDIFTPLDDLMNKSYSAKTTTLKYKNPPQNDVMTFEIPFKAEGSVDDFVSDFQEKFEKAFEDKQYIIAGFFDFKQVFDGSKPLPEYDAFWSYSLCHFFFSYNIFDNESNLPEAGAFAPCTMYMYIKKGTTTLVVGMPKLSNWANAFGMSGKQLELTQNLDKEIISIMESLGAKTTGGKTATMLPKSTSTSTPPATPSTPVATIPAPQGEVINIKLPAVPAVPVAPTVNTINSDGTPAVSNPAQNGTTNMNIDRSIKFSKRVPPSEDSKEPTAQNQNPGEISNGRVAAYLRGGYKSADEIKNLLTAKGFAIVATTNVPKNDNLTTIVFTNDTLTQMAQKENRAFAANLRVLIDNENKIITITNPNYLLRAFMQNDYVVSTSGALLKSLKEVFGDVADSVDELKDSALSEYHFMVSMPYYEDMITIKEGDHATMLAQVAKNPDIAFVQKINDTTSLVGVQLSKRVVKFVDKIGTQNAILLPYPMVIHKGKAQILDPKYYIALMYPMLKMSEFMTIATTPGGIENDCKAVFAQ